MANRSWLYVPGDARDKLDGAVTRGADAVIVDLEDAVVPSARAATRSDVVEWLSSLGPGADAAGPCEVWVRINAAEDWRADDLVAIAPMDVDGIVVPKATSSLLAEVHDTLSNTARQGVAVPRVAGLVEDARALVGLAELAATPGLSHLGMGEADLRAELHLDPSDDEAELRPLRLSVVVASAAAGIAPPVGATSTDFRDLDALRRSTDRLRRLGFAGRTAIHPAQVPVINEVFTPSAHDEAAARQVVGRLGEAAADGTGVVTDADGRMLDEAVARRARWTIALADAARRGGDTG